MPSNQASPPTPIRDPTELFNPLIRQWFAQLGPPTDIQRRAWPSIAKSEHCLITAPTGSGKTLTAFLWAINGFVTGSLATGRTRVLYISPLKALNNDIRNNLLQPLTQLKELAAQKGLPFPDIRVQTRSGDTDAAERRTMLRRPPEILITTPESLNLLLSSKGGLSILRDLNTVILDEIHSLIANKRGAYLISAIERLVPLSGEFQRIALSATVKPLAVAAEFLAGYQYHHELQKSAPPARTPAEPDYQARRVEIIESRQSKQYQVDVCYPEAIANKAADKNLWDALASELVSKIRHNQSTLIFVNSRALCEKLTHKINVAAEQTIAYAHHGSLSRDIRSAVEAGLKRGELAAIVATASLELGVDIGALDEVFIVQTSGSLASTMQRIGRAGHQVGQVSKGKLYPTHPQDFLEAVVLMDAIACKDIEPVKPVSCPLDVLAQVIVSMTSQQSWDLDELYYQLRCSRSFHLLKRSQFDLIVNMLAGRYGKQRVRELRPRVSVDRLDNTIIAKRSAVLALYSSGGVIPNRGYFQLRHADNSARIGELDEEFVWEARVGKTFTLGTQYWQIQKITHNDVYVVPGKAGAAPPPFWKAEELSRSFYFSERILNFLEHANQQLTISEQANPNQPNSNRLTSKQPTNKTLGPTSATAMQMDSAAMAELEHYLKRQRAHTQCDLPHRHHLVVEHIHSLLGHSQGNQIVIHTGWGSPVNRPWALAMEAAWHQHFGETIEIYTSNESLVLQLADEISAEALLALVNNSNLDRLLRQRLEGSGFFGARFRECAGRALLLSQGQFQRRQPLWMSRLQSQKLFDSVRHYDDFPILLESWRTCLVDELELDALRQLLAEIDSGELRWTAVTTQTPSPMAGQIAWEQINQYMYRDDAATASASSNLRDELLQELVFDPQQRPRISASVNTEFQLKRTRLLPGYAPETASDLLDWVKERVLIPLHEWQALLQQASSQLKQSAAKALLTSAITGKMVLIQQGSAQFILARENLDHLLRSLYDSNEIETVQLSLLDSSQVLEKPNCEAQLSNDEAQQSNEIAELEQSKERARILLERYGVVFKELLSRESKPFRWSSVFKALRLMELGREIVSGYFFKNISGPQFISHQALRLLRQGLPEHQLYWHNACDPLSLCGVSLPELKRRLPKRLESTHLLYKGSELILISSRNGKELQFNIAPDDTNIPDCLAVLRHLLYRSRHPLAQIPIATINQEPALQSDYIPCLQAAFDLYKDHKQVILQGGTSVY